MGEKDFGAPARWLGTATLVLALLAGEANAASTIRTDVGAAFPETQLVNVLSQSGVIVTLGEAELFDFLGNRLTANEKSVIYLSLSSEYRIAAALSGSIAVEGSGELLSPGEVAVWPQRPGRLRVREFDIDRFLASSSAALPADAVASLQHAAEGQRDRIWWGALRRTAENAQAPIPPLFEAMRRDMLLRPVVIALRQEARGDVEKLAELAVGRFLEGLRERDVPAVRDLMAPSLFAPDRRTPSAWLQVRHDVARSLVESELGRNLAGAVIAGGNLGTGYMVRAPDGAEYRIKMSAEDEMVFVAEIVPESAP